ncbi:chlorocatechol 1,2-dioxygenase-like [Paramacrobiotus metropolitanus]|uniref:chlorocatechol 1,2-dioxygenase-like n=1 Tax=Paramacrobiotus metropolitanus TaxID=2943436 RepID=UPI0024457688|nr:chlorocatechol 1,2-dioxygenase-like [Paramacrobiotus metropolitanus]
MLTKVILLVAVLGCVHGGNYDATFLKSGETLLPKALQVKAGGSCTPTAKDILGPYYKANAPLRPNNPVPYICNNLPANDRLFLNGTISLRSSAAQCGKPVRALLDIWHANADGVYSDTAPTSKDFSCRVKVYTNDNGAYSLTSIFPGRYDDGGYRPAHIHFKITPVDKNNNPIGNTLTTQLYFAEDFYLSPRDSCGVCGSGQPTLISHVEHVGDIKTYVGSWNVLL